MADPYQELVEIFANRLIDFRFSAVESIKSKRDHCVEVIEANLGRKCLAASDEFALKRYDRFELFLLYLLAYLCPYCGLVIFLNLVVEALGLLPLAD